VKVTDTTGLTAEQKAKLAYALTLIRERQGRLRGWTQDRTGTPPHTIRLLRRSKGKLQEVYEVCRGEPQH
jgi:hypothetical protein